MTKPQAEKTATDSDKPTTRQNDPELPAGDSAPRPAWPLVAGAMGWALWIGFLVVMMVIRMKTTAV